MRALAADVNTNRLASKHPALRHTARLCESTHDQPTYAVTVASGLIQCHSLLTYRLGWQVSVTIIIMTRWVQVKHDELLEYVAMVEYLRKDHTKLQEQIKDSKTLASIIEATYKERLDKLTDLILDIHPANYKYERGLLDAYNIVSGNE